MANITAEKEVTEKARKLISFPMKDGIQIFKGAIVKATAAGLDNMAAGAADFMGGIAYESVNNSGNGESIKVLREGVYLLNGAGFTATDLGKTVYASDNQTVSTTQGADEIAVGNIVSVESSTAVYVDLKC